MPQVEVIGVYRLDAQKPVHLVELTVRGADGAFSMGEFTQAIPEVPSSEWEVAHLEQVLSPDGTRIVADDERAWRRPELFRGEVRFVFFFRSLDLQRPLRTPFGDVTLPGELELPERLSLAFSAISPPQMMTWRTRIIAFATGAVALAVVQLAFFDAAHKSPALLSPPLLFFNTFVAFLCVNIFAFGVNAVRAVVSIKGCKDATKIQETMEPVLHGYVADQRILRYTDIPFFASLGGMLAAGVLWVFR